MTVTTLVSEVSESHNHAASRLGSAFAWRRTPILIDAMARRLLVATALLATSAFGSLVGTKVPGGVELDLGFPPTKVVLSERVRGKNVILVGLPGAFTPT